MSPSPWHSHNPEGRRRVVVTKDLPGRHWLDLLARADCRVEIYTGTDLLSPEVITAALGPRCAGVIGQLTERWDDALFKALQQAGGRVYSNYAVGYDNVDLAAATRRGIAVGNTPGVLTETTAEMAVALTLAAARRLGEAERYLRAGRFSGWLPGLLLGDLLEGKTLGVVGVGRIGGAYARMMALGHRMHVVYHSRHPHPDLEEDIAAWSALLASRGAPGITCRRAESLEDLLQSADCVSLHTRLDAATRHLIDARALALMKKDAILVNTSRGPVIKEDDLVAHCRTHPGFRAGLDVFEKEPDLADGLVDLENVVIVPHIGSATRWTREGMAALAAANVAGVLMGYPLWRRPDMLPFRKDNPPQAVPSIVNAEALGLPVNP
jgi:hydroxypyruvate reductase 1